MKRRILTPMVLLTSLFVTLSIASCNSKPITEHVSRSYQGEGAPSNSLGENGDTYTDTLTGDLYQKEDGQWVLKHNAVPESYSGEGEPDPALGKNGDTYVNTINGAEYIKENDVWVITKKGDTTYVVTFNLNGGHFANGDTTYPDQIVREGRWISEPSSEPIKEHTTFMGWYAVNSDAKWNFKGTPVYDNVDLVAKYSVNEDEKITYTVNPNNGQPTYTVDTFVGDYSYPTVPQYDGFDFQGWYIQSTDEKYNGNVTASLNGQTVIAKWEKAKFNVSYIVEPNDEVTITGLIDINTTSIAIPNTINGRRVTKIAKTAFNSRASLVYVYIPSNVKVIEEGAFRGTNKLLSISVDSDNLYYTSENGILYTKNKDTLVCYPIKCGSTYSLPSSVKRIASYAFYYHRDGGIASINLNEGLEEIGDYAFYLNESMSSISFPSTLKTIGRGAFYGSSTSSEDNSYISPQGVLTNVNFNEGLKTIKEFAFVNQYFKDSFTLPSTVETIEPYAFANCTAITKLTLPSGLKTLGGNAFAGCTGILETAVASGNTNYCAYDGIIYSNDMSTLVMCPSGRVEKVVIPEGVSSIADYGFYMVDELQEYEFPSTLTTIGKQAFSQTYGLRSFTIPNSVTSIGEEAFYASGISSISIGTGLSTLPEALFCDTKLTSVEIPGNVKTIGHECFAGSLLTSVTLNEGVEVLDDGAFASTKVSSINFPESLTSIGNSCFSGANVTSLYVGKNLSNIGDTAFYSSSTSSITLTSISCNPSNEKYSANNNVLFSKDGKTLYFSSLITNTSYSIPEGVEIIGPFAFAHLKSITSLTFPSTLTSISEGAFMYSKATSLTFPSSLKSIGDGAFSFSDATEVNFSEGLETIGESAFAMSDLTSATLPNSLISVGTTAFAKCLSLTSITLGSGLQTIGDFAFSDNKITGVITIPSTVTSIGKGVFASTVSNYGQTLTNIIVDENNENYTSENGLLMDKGKTKVIAYASNSSISITIPSTVTTIEDYAMSASKSNLVSLTLPSNLNYIGEAGLAMLPVGVLNIPSSVTYIGKYAFYNYKSSQSIIFNCTQDYALTNFDQYFLSNCSAHVTYTEAL